MDSILIVYSLKNHIKNHCDSQYKLRMIGLNEPDNKKSDDDLKKKKKKN